MLFTLRRNNEFAKASVRFSTFNRSTGTRVRRKVGHNTVCIFSFQNIPFTHVLWLWHVLSVHAAISFHLFKRHDEIVFASYLTVDDRTADLLDWLDVAEYRAALYSTG